MEHLSDTSTLIGIVPNLVQDVVQAYLDLPVYEATAVASNTQLYPHGIPRDYAYQVILDEWARITDSVPDRVDYEYFCKDIGAFLHSYDVDCSDMLDKLKRFLLIFGDAVEHCSIERTGTGMDNRHDKQTIVLTRKGIGRVLVVTEYRNHEQVHRQVPVEQWCAE